MTWCSGGGDEAASAPRPTPIGKRVMLCASCGLRVQYPDEGAAAAAAMPVGLPAGVKFDPTDQELLEHLEGKTWPETQKLHPLIDEFIPTIDGENGICYTHPEMLPGVSRDGLVQHFFHRPSKAYTTGNRKRRKVHTGGTGGDHVGGETRWHKTGKTRPVLAGASGRLLGHKKILVLYTNYGKLRKPEKTNWVMHQYHLGADEEEKDGELVVSKVFFQTQPRKCSGGVPEKSGGCVADVEADDDRRASTNSSLVDFYGSSIIGYSGAGGNGAGGEMRRSFLSPAAAAPPLNHLLHGFAAVHAHGTSFLG